MVHSISSSPSSSTIGSPKSKKNGFFNKLIKKKDNPSRNSSINGSSNSNTTANTSTEKLQKVFTHGSSRSSRKRDLSEGRGIEGDNDSYIYNDEDGDVNTMMDYDSDLSSAGSLGRSLSVSSRVKSNTKFGNYENHRVDERVSFPSVDETLFYSDLPTLNLREDEEPPWVGLTYESFLTPKYVKVSRRNKQSPRSLNHLFLAQELNVESESNDDDSRNGEIYTMSFSKDGKYLACAGRDAILRVYKVISSPLARLEYNQNEKNLGGVGGKEVPRSNKRDFVFDPAPVFHTTPSEYKGHTRSILSLAWSKNNFIITGSMDKTVKLWHVDRPNCLQTFQHEDFVTAVEFHPLDDRFFLSGSLDNDVRLWSILEKSVSFSRNLGEDVLITALAFSPDGLNCIVGGFNGSVFILETKGLHIVNRVEIKERSIAHPFHDKSNGNKITGIQVFENPLKKNSTDLEKWTVLITTNDSKVRMISTDKKKLITRFRGLTNNSSSIAASSSDDHKYIISGSEDHYCYVWENNNSIINNKLRQSLRDFVIDGKQQINDFHHKYEKYTRLIHSNKFLGKLLEDDDKQDYISNENNSYSCFHAHHSRCNVAIFAPESTKNSLQLSDDLVFDLYKRGQACRMDPSKCCCPNAKDHKHEENNGTGDIIVTTDQYGLIRVFRQDIAWSIRSQFIEVHKKCQAHRNDQHQQCIQDGKPILRNKSNGDGPSPTRGGFETSKSIKPILSSKISSPSHTFTNYTYSPPPQNNISPINIKVDDLGGVYSSPQNNISQSTLNAVPNEHAQQFERGEQFPPVNSQLDLTNGEAQAQAQPQVQPQPQPLRFESTDRGRMN
ncbi:uncharacterized protein KGF55_003236 [Candida pseudojiufengensis]|uniref:uncharacterized protein n=1 Tax=Candida pseudojiufengensis TaxID=497109 RepID=UPI002225804B|nr:uncharacterized protein KGF55_003236 [Candida pseudojiufengensis]KAI5962160.1 hypothetical protein KGF55_003236 [Candida pseudojiufengensis]